MIPNPKHQSWDNPRCEILKSMFNERKMSKGLCLLCKGGRNLCGLGYCPLLKQVSTHQKTEIKLKDHLFGPSPSSIFVGWKGYPEVSVGPMLAIDDRNTEMIDDPGKWYGLNFNHIVKLRSSLVRSKMPLNVNSFGKITEKMQEIVLSIKPTDIEVLFNKKPSYNLSFSPISQPMGPTGEIKTFSIAENTKIPKKVDYTIQDDLNAVNMAFSLYKNGFDVYYLSKILSSGVLGKKDNRKLVPTRWGITSIHSIIADKLIEKIKEFPPVEEYEVYSNQYLENHFEILLSPGKYEYEQFEVWSPHTIWTSGLNKPTIVEEYEPYEGRTKYAEKEGGGFYASRLGVAEGLNQLKKQARCVVFREIHEGYIMPVGVWECLENVRNAFKQKPMRFSTKDAALKYLSQKLRLPITEYLKESVILKQKRLTEF